MYSEGDSGAVWYEWGIGGVLCQVLDLRRALHAEPGSAEALRLAALRGDDVSAAPAPQHHTFDAVMQHHALRTHPTVALHPTSTKLHPPVLY